MLTTCSHPVRGTARLSALVAVTAALTAAVALLLPAAASASHRQITMIQDGPVLQADPAGTLAEFRALGATTVRVLIFWHEVAPAPDSGRRPRFNATDPNAYPARGWAPYDQIVRLARQYGITVDLTIAGGAPVWADGRGMPSTYRRNAAHWAWKPSARDYGQFVQAVATRYDGRFTPRGAGSPLPRVHFWALWNEPNFGQDLGPQATDGSTVSYAPMLYRNLVNAGYSALRRTGHSRDTILIGEFAARGATFHRPTRMWKQGLPGNGGQTKPLQFIRTLYCVDGNYRPLRGWAARSTGCPTTAGGSRRFRRNNPGLFDVSGVGDHPYPGNGSPLTDGRSDPDFAAFPELGNLAHTLDRANRAYGSGKRYPVYNDEYGYITDPPNTTRVAVTGGHYVSPWTAAEYLNWAEYLSWRSPRIASYMQYLLDDPPSVGGAAFASGLYTSTGRQKWNYNAFVMPLWLPRTRGRNLEVWGAARPAHFTGMDTHQRQAVSIQFQPHFRGPYRNIRIVHANGYFDLHVRFPSAGRVRLAYRYPRTDSLLAPVGVQGRVILSRTVSIH